MLKIVSAMVVRTVRGPDTILLETDRPNPAFPFNDCAVMKVTAAQGTGVEWVRVNCGIEPQVVG